MPARARRRRSAEPFPTARRLRLPAPAEDVVVSAEGQLVCGLTNGYIVRLDPDGNRMETIAHTHGRPLGLEALPDGRVLVCDADRGLLRADPRNGAVEVLVSHVGGAPLRFCSNVSARADGSMWFTQSTSRFDLEDYLGDILEHRGSGRVFRRDPDGSVDVVVSGLQFANGIALTADESSVIVAETGAYQLTRVPTTKPVAREVIASNLPGLPDNVSRAGDGLFWVAMVTPRNALLDHLSTRPGVRKLIWRLPPSLQPRAARTVWVMAFRADGSVARDLQTQREDFWYTTGVVEYGGRLYLASIQVPAILALDVVA
jgi:sugar lactone lactonase YvrE